MAPAHQAWAADFSPQVQNSKMAGFRYVQVQTQGAVTHTTLDHMHLTNAIDAPASLGRCLALHLCPDDKRIEALPRAADFLDGDVCWFRLDFVLGSDWDFAPAWGPLINQIHQSTGSGSPPIQFEARTRNGQHQLYLSGGQGPDYCKELGGDPTDPTSTDPFPLTIGVKYKLVYGVHFSTASSTSTIEVWIDDQLRLTPYTIPLPTVDSAGPSYWKGATFYTGPGEGGTVWQNAHRMGPTRASVS